MGQYIPVYCPDIFSEIVADLGNVEVASSDPEFRYRYVGSIIVIWRKVAVFYEPFCRNALYQFIVHIGKSRAVEPFGCCRNAQPSDVGEGVIYPLVCRGKAVMILIGYDQIDGFLPAEPSCHCLYHHNPAQRHIHPVGGKGLSDLVAELSAVNEKQNASASVGKAFCDLCLYHGFSAAARENHARGLISVMISSKNTVNKLLLIISQFHQNGRSSLSSTGRSPRLSVRASAVSVCRYFGFGI